MVYINSREVIDETRVTPNNVFWKAVTFTLPTFKTLFGFEDTPKDNDDGRSSASGRDSESGFSGGRSSDNDSENSKRFGPRGYKSITDLSRPHPTGDRSVSSPAKEATDTGPAKSKEATTISTWATTETILAESANSPTTTSEKTAETQSAGDTTIENNFNDNSSLQVRSEASAVEQRYVRRGTTFQRNFGRFHKRYFGCGLDQDKAFIRRRGFLNPTEIRKAKITQVTSVRGAHRGLTINVMTDRSLRARNKVEHFELHKFENGPEAFCRWLSQEDPSKRIKHALDPRKQAFVLHMLDVSRDNISPELDSLYRFLQEQKPINMKKHNELIERDLKRRRDPDASDYLGRVNKRRSCARDRAE